MKKLNIFLLVFVFLILAYPKVEAKVSDDRGPLSRIKFIHYRKGYKPANLPEPKVAFGKPPWAGSGKNKPKESSCYQFLAKDAKWRTTENVLINDVDQANLTAIDIESTFNIALATWNFEVISDIFGTASLASDATFKYNDLDNYHIDNKNVVMFGSYGDPRVIAVTYVWGYFSGRPANRELVEWDMLFNDSFVWGDATVDPTLMDFQNIAVHELGHSAGLGDLYQESCIDETMYGYSDEGETSKRDLNAGDIAGIMKLYE